MGLGKKEFLLTGTAVLWMTLVAAAAACASGSPSVGGTFTGDSTQSSEVKAGAQPPAACAKCHQDKYQEWAGLPMGNASIDPVMRAQLSVANQDVPGIGDFCLRCHTPVGWLNGKSEPPGGDWWGSSMTGPPDRDKWGNWSSEKEGLTCDFCHRLYDNAKRVSRADRQPLPKGSGSFMWDGDLTRSYDDEHVALARTYQGAWPPPAGVPVLPPSKNDPFLLSAEMCGTCHDVTNPALKSMNDPQSLHPMERTYTEWKYSWYGDNAYTCQNCHLPTVKRSHSHLVGGSAWLSGMWKALYPNKDAGWVEAGFDVPQSRDAAWDALAASAEAMLKGAASMDVNRTSTGLWVKVTNLSGHKLPTGYPEGRRMWLNVRAFDANGRLIQEDCGYSYDTATLDVAGCKKIYEQRVESADGREYHFALNQKITKDNRIPPKGYKKLAYELEGAHVVGADYQNGQSWDITEYSLPAGTVRWEVYLLYQSQSKEAIDALRDSDVTRDVNHGGTALNTPDSSPTWGQTLYNTWLATGKSKPVVTARLSSDGTFSQP